MRTFHLEFSEEMMRVVSNALATQPYHVVAATIAQIQQQINAQSLDNEIADKSNGKTENAVAR